MHPIPHLRTISYEKILDTIKLGVFDLLQMGVALISSERAFIYCNKSFKTMFGLSADVSGKGIDDVLITKSQNDIASTNIKVVAYANRACDKYGMAISYPVYAVDQKNMGIFIEVLPIAVDKALFHKLMHNICPEALAMYSSSVTQKAERRQLYTFASLVGDSPAMHSVCRLGYKLSNSHEPILVCGETGTGKEMVAQALHMASPRCHGPFVSMNCAALPHDLMESELFGYTSGAFTGAKSGGMKGKFEEANNGTIFLDEIGEIPLSLQAKLLRVLENGEIQKIGHKGRLYSNFRLIAATNKDLPQMVRQGTFRADLYHRISVFELNIPPLRERGDDIFLLIHAFIEHELGVSRSGRLRLAPDLVRMLQAHPWTGNIRELKNMLAYAVFVLEEYEEELGIQHFPPRFLESIRMRAEAPPVAVAAPEQMAPAFSDGDGRGASSDYRQVLHDVMTKFQFNKVKAAKELGISRSTLYRRLRAYNFFV